MKHFLSLFIGLILFFLAGVSSLIAAGFQLTAIGSMNLDGVLYDHLWYSSGNVTFTGIGVVGQTVTATIGTNSATVTVDSSGNWSYTTTLADGDHSINFSSEAGNITFTLTVGPVPEGVGAISGTGVPASGNSTPTLEFVAIGVGFILAPLALRKRILNS